LAALAAIVILPRVLNLDVFVGPDELAELGRDNRFTVAVAEMNWAGTLVGDGKPSVTLMWLNTIGAGIKWLWLQLSGAGLPFIEVVALDRPFEIWAERRLVLALFSGLQILAAWPLLCVVWDKWVATVAVGFMAIEPFFLAFTRMIRGDSLVAGFILLSVLGALAYLKTGRYSYNLFSGTMGGLAALTKFIGGITAPMALLIYGVAALSRRRQGIPNTGRWFLASLVGLGLATAIVSFGLWPAWWFRPFDTFNLLWGKIYYHGVDAATQRASTYFWGTLHPFGPGPWFYPVLAALRLTPWLFFGSLIAIGDWVWQVVRTRSMSAHLSRLGLIIMVAGYWLAMTIPGQKIDRYLVPAVPGLAVLAAIAWVNAARWAKSRVPHRIATSPIPGGVALGLGLLAVVHVAAYHPLYSTYYDPLIGNSKTVQWALPVGQGEGVDVALKHLSTLPDDAESTVLCGTNFPRCRPFFSGELWHQEELRTARWFATDYVLWHIDEQQIGAFPDGVLAYLRRQPPVHIARYHGIDYTWLYPVPQAAFLADGSKLEGVATLLGYDVEGSPLGALSPGDQLKLRLYWQNEGQAARQRFWWRVVDSDAYIWVEAQAEPLPEFKAAAAQKGAVLESEAGLSLPPDMPPGVYYLKAGFEDNRGDVGQFALPAEGSQLMVQGPSVGESKPGTMLNEVLASDLLLRGYDVSSTEGVKVPSYAPIPGEALWVTLYWRAIHETTHDYVIALRMLDQYGGEVALGLGRPVRNSFPTQTWPANASVRDPWRVSLPLDLTPGAYQLTISLFDAADSTELAQVRLGTMDVVARRVSLEAPPMQFQANLPFGDVATLLGYSLSGDLLSDSARLRVTLHWRGLRATEEPYMVSVRLVDTNGLVLAEHQSQPAGGAVPTTSWQPDEVVTDLHEMDMAVGEPVQVNLEVRLLDAGGKSVPLRGGPEALIVTDIQQKAMWRLSTQ